MNDYKPYPAYKDSGIEWLGEIPAHWNLRRLKTAIKTVVNGLWGDAPQGDENDLVCIRVADFDYDTLGVSATNLTIRNIPAPKQSYRLLSEGDLLIEKSGGGDIWTVGRVVSYNLDYKAVSSNFISKIEPHETTDNRFLCYVFAAAYSVGLNIRSIKQTTGIQNIDLKSYLNKIFGFPPLSEQRAIAKYLDRETAYINALIAKKRELIDLLRRQRTAVISYAVTKGLDLSAPLKDSGVAWLGKIPAHWDLRRLKFVAQPAISRLERKPPDKLYIGLENIEPSTGKLLLDTPNDSIEGTVFTFQEGDVLFGKLRPYLAKVVHAHFDGVCTSELLVLRPKRAFLHDRFLFYFLLSYQFISIVNSMTYGAKMPRANMTQIGNLPATLPPLPEQRAIAAFLDSETARIDELITKIEESITLLQQQRAALISAAVTGKIDVREQG